MTKKLLMTVLVSGFIAGGCSADSEDTQNAALPEEETIEQQADSESIAADDFLIPFDGTLTHVHGMGYIEKEEGLYFASHTGLKVYRDGNWFETEGMYNDYMGFNAVDEGVYTSGHPGMDSDLPDPIGMQKSTDGGRTLEALGFVGETDFHLMAAGYRSYDLFVLNPQKNSEMEAGFYFSGNDGADWQRLEPEGIDGDLLSLAIHVNDSQLMAAAGTAGIFISKDKGSTFERLTAEGEIGTAVHFTEDKLYYAGHGDGHSIKSYEFDGGDTETIELPALNEEVAVYIAVNPSNDQEIVFSTNQGNTHLSNDGGKSWNEIMNAGQVE